MVTTPQHLANLDAKRCINMIRKLKVNVLGVVENYTGEMFGEGSGKELATEMDLPFLGSIAMRSDYRDTSKPTALRNKDVMAEYQGVLKNVKVSLEQLGLQAA